MRYRLLYFTLSLLVLLPGLLALGRWGLRPAIDFTGGTRWEIKTDLQAEQLRQSLQSEPDLAAKLHQIEGTNQGTLILKLAPLNEKEKERFWNLWQKQGELEEVSFESVGAILGRELLVKTVLGILLATGLILLYVAWRFQELMYGVCAILAMLHDTFIVLGIFALLGHFAGVEVDTLFVTAVLTVLSFSVHDTVVVYDRIRELKRLFPRQGFTTLVNQAVNETLPRSLNNSLTIIFMLLALLLLGGSSLRWFVVALLIGTIAGTYSSTFTAAPLLVVWYNRRGKSK